MILSRQVFEYQKRPIIEKVRIKLPFRYQALFPNEGCFLYIKDSHSRVVSSGGIQAINPHEAVLLKCGSYFVDWVHNLNCEEVEVLAFHLYADVLKSMYQSGFPQTIKKRIRDQDAQALVNDSVLQHFIENLAFYFDNPELINEDVLELKIKELVLILTQSTSAPSVLSLLKDLFNPSQISVRDVVQRHLFNDLSIADLAHLCGVSTSSFRRIFEEEFSETPSQYILNQRLQKATELLQCTGLSIGQIAYQTGFKDPSYFSRVFKKKTGFTPVAFKQNSLKDVL